MTSTRSVLALLLLLGTAGCGGAAPNAETAAQTQTHWTSAQLRKLDPALRTQVQEDPSGRYAVSVLFVELPTDEELEALALNRIGERVVGNVAAETLRELAARDDVERIEMLEDVGYETL